MGEPLLDVRGLRTWFPIKKGVLRKTVGHVRAVDGVSFSIGRGETLALVGESGCGKSTVGRSLLRILDPQEGQVVFDGTDLLSLSQARLRPYRQQLQMVFQDPATSLNPRLRVRDLVAEGMESFGIGGSDDARTRLVSALLERVGLDPEKMWRFAHEFSGGQRQRIGIARALAVNPKLIVLDEAVSALDVSIQAQILNLLRGLQEERGLSYLFITHDLSVVQYLAHRVCVMYLGQIVEESETLALFEKPAHPYTQGLLAAVPSIDPAKPLTSARVLGDIPSASAPPSGCRFHTRCPYVFDRCPREEPPLYEMGPGQTSRCFLNDATTAKTHG
jgi:oligopeptide/dipeptide ABC transporter ATP-binding protein